MRISIKNLFLTFAVYILLFAGTTFSYSSDERLILAILPFKNLSGYKSMDWISEGIASSLITKLSAAEDLVIVERYYIRKILNETKLKMAGVTEGTAADAGKLLGATAMVLGEFQYFDRKIKISMRVIDVSTGKIETSIEETGELKDIFLLEEELARRILSLMDKSMLEIGDFEFSAINTTSIKAYKEYSLAKKAWDGRSAEPENIRKAVEHYTKALKYDKNFFLAALELGDALGEIAEFDKALKYFKRALKISKKTLKDKKAMNYCRNQAYAKKGMIYLKKGQLNKARISLERALKVHSECFTSYNLLGHIYRQQVEIEKAISAYRKAIEIEPYNPAGYYNLGMALTENGEKTEAVKSFKKAVQIDFFEEFTDSAQKYLNTLTK